MKALGRWFRGAGALGIAFGLVAACGSDSTEDKRVLAELSQGCVLNSDCKSPLVCVFRKCHEQCTETRDCPDGLLCVAADEDGLRVCQLPTETKCYSTHDCPGKQVCGPDGRCRDFCDSTADCGDGQTCAAQGACAEPEELDPEGKLPEIDAGTGGSGGVAGSAGSGGTAATGGAGGTAGSGGGSAGMDAGVDASGDGSADANADASGCLAGMADCDSNPADCETALNQITSCGSCTTTCDASNGNVICNSSLVCEVVACNSGFGNCDANAGTGCETSLVSDAANCGECGRVCNGTCSNGQCPAESVGMVPGTPQFHALGKSDVFVVTGSGTYVLTRVPKDGSGATPMDTDTATVTAMAADGKSVYLAVSGSGIVPYSQSTYQKGAPLSVPANVFPKYLAVQGSAFYWEVSTGAVYTAPKDDASPQLPLAPSVATNAARALAVTSNAVYRLTYQSGYVLEAIPIAGGALAPVATFTAPVAMTTWGDTVYLGVNNQGVYRHTFDPKKTTQDAPTQLLPQTGTFYGLASDGVDVQFVRASSGFVYSLPVTGGSSASILGPISNPDRVYGVDGQWVWVGASTTVSKVPK